MKHDDRITVWTTSGSVGVTVGGMWIVISDGGDGSTLHAREQLALAILDWHEVVEQLEARLEREKREHTITRSKVPPASSLRLLGPGIIRVDTDGHPWVMNKPEPAAGWGTNGIRFDDWDDLFRHLNVRIASAGHDEHGPFFRFDMPPKGAA